MNNDPRATKVEAPYPAVTEELLAEVVRRIRAVGDPLKIILFGSRARGDAGPYSDLDILVVEESELPRWRRSPRYYEALAGAYPHTEIVAWTPSEIYDWSRVPNHFITMAVREGKVVYERPA